ncbi:DUF5928 domain-containing protein [Paracoccus spongiarum]|uniref:Peptide O-xylosyltransferase n=1 Tax=Paracoccus spongiarum TaxID=3064387 RepID=A0ABT9JAK0_9RHOB|nr:DUF5928 domain-containing protein [Paracoccus sp. 2205BS29-5]MDP5306849.1 DUF5928 domain-containing protein [Paracoccus sp. 2205BS29-5]
MARIAFILLTHKDPQGVIDQARRLTAAGDFVAIHHDRNAPREDYRRIREALADHPRVCFAPRRIRCGWGEWSLVGATLTTLREAEARFSQATHFYLLSGDCMPVKSAEYARRFLDSEECDHIECVDFLNGGWIKTGITEERLIYRHWFNERRQKALFYASMAVQKRLGLQRSVPEGLQVMIGSQWWCLRRRTVEAVLELIATVPAIPRFFRTTWIPDETFFQTLVAHLVPRTQIRSRSLTFLMFTDYGMPVTFYNDHYDLLLRQDSLFARKISAEAQQLRAGLGALWQSEGQEFPISAEGPRLIRFLTGRGRVGRRFAPRAWETDGSLGRSHVVHLIVAKKWHVAKRLTARIRALTAIPAVDYVFDEADAALPDMGGVASTVAKRARHRRALVKLLFEQLDATQLVLCLDPSGLNLISDFAADRAEARILFIDTPFDDDYLRGHMGRIGLANDSTPADVLDRLLPVVRGDLEHEVERLRDMGFSRFETCAAAQGIERNAAALARFLDVSPEIAQDLAATPNLFDD